MLSPHTPTSVTLRKPAPGDASHEQAAREMKRRWRRPKKSLDWYLGAKKAFAALPDD